MICSLDWYSLELTHFSHGFSYFWLDFEFIYFTLPLSVNILLIVVKSVKLSVAEITFLSALKFEQVIQGVFNVLKYKQFSDESLATKVYRKATHSDHYLQFDSHHPRNTHAWGFLDTRSQSGTGDQWSRHLDKWEKTHQEVTRKMSVSWLGVQRKSKTSRWTGGGGEWHWKHQEVGNTRPG